ncbi:MAG: hypothetical protein FP825_10215 [Hyphomonas sp.]|uniref:hypothetical protein n=1 Tax=Hyphomonas sp. TaxID=87 RepID=UPI00184D9E89|nr:hypothetical protein [Hyphomonas sp.]MBA3068844.1 hypothetical protein [Hyphomonas sp.]MBU4062945.1 hypothetical protein [Alphaproteobacteria bacterium]
MIRLGRITIAAACLSLMAAPSLAQAGPPGGAPPAAADPNRILAELSNVAQITAAAKKCNWTDPMYVLASESMLAIKAADLKATVAPEVRGQVDTALAQAAASVSSFACKQPDGKDPPQQHQITMFVMDQYWRMIAHVDVLGSLRWGEVFRYTPEERKALDKEIAHIQEFKGYSYYEAANPLETLADKTITLACRERPSNGKPCRPVPPELEGNAPTIRTMIETVETFGKAVAAEEIRVKQAFLASVGDITAFSAIGDKACTRDALVVKMRDALTKSETTEDSFGSMTREVIFVEKFRLGIADRVGWVLLFRSMMSGSIDNRYFILAEDGGEWDEESARIGVGDVTDLYAAQVALIDTLPPAERAKATQEAKESITATYFMNFNSMGLMQSINGNGSVSLTPCTAD